MQLNQSGMLGKMKCYVSFSCISEWFVTFSQAEKKGPA